MRFSRLIAVLLTSSLAGSLAGAAWAQDSAGDIIRRGMAKQGVYDGYSVEEGGRSVRRPQDDQPWDGLRISEAFTYADRERGWSFVVVVQNFSTIDYCIRPRFHGMPRGRLYVAQSGNQIVKAGESLTIFTSADETSTGSFTPFEEVAFWRPDYSRENGSYCRAVAPVGLDDWLTEAPSQYETDFEGSRR